MKHIATVALMLNLGVAAIYAQQKPVNMTFSGSNVATTINLQPGTVTDETQLAGKGTLGAFTFRELHADGPSPQLPAGCSGPSFAVVAGAGVFRFQDEAITVNYQIGGGTGRFTGASGNLTMTATIAPILFNASNAPALLTNTGEFKGTVFGVAKGQDGQD